MSNTPYQKHSSKDPQEPIDAKVLSNTVEAVTQGQTVYFRALHRTGLHQLSIGLSLVVICSSVNLAIGQLIALFANRLVVRESIMRVYLIFISFGLIFNELEWSSVLKSSPLLQKYTWRGLVYTFIGVVADNLSDVGNNNNNWNYNYNQNSDGYVSFSIPSLEHATEIIIIVSAWSLFGIGVIYFVLGCCFLQNKIEGNIQEYRERLQIADQVLSNTRNTANGRLGGRLGDEIGIA